MISSLVNGTEKTIRYAIPGTWIYLLLAGIQFKIGDKSQAFEFNSGIFSISILLGIISFIVYRQIMDVLDHSFVVIKWNLRKLQELFVKTTEKEDNLKDYIYYKYAHIHLSILLPIISFFAILNTSPAQTFFGIGKCSFSVLNASVLVLAIINYVFMWKILHHDGGKG